MQLRSHTVLMSCLLIPAAWADQVPEPGFRGNVSLHAGWAQERSQSNTDSNQRITELGRAPQSDDTVLVLPMWDLAYRFEGFTGEVYFQSALGGMADNFYMEAGYRHYLPDGSRLGIGLIPGVPARDAWEDPFALNVDRVETDMTVSGAMLHYDAILGSGFNLELGYGERKLDVERSGEQGYSAVQQSQLRREGDLLYASLGHGFDLGEQTSLDARLRYLDDNADGEAMANQRVGVEFELTHSIGRHVLQFAGEWTERDYDATHPVFDKKRDDTLWGASFAYIYAEPFSWKQTSLIARVGWSELDSNIDFYDEENVLVSLGIGYDF
ncbi:DUF2860 family protein [Chitinolyticbacter meiyuanensis]|uniref:DUF2860 family protein n=1 Tax=Chitinolyticbacter meiyuanensis TaxID=682798 RepID=UPI001651D960|nr:DUF2860 family protein [Chitinolyticbacter meiyuanensis]